jgi:hypothetical protein
LRSFPCIFLAIARISSAGTPGAKNSDRQAAYVSVGDGIVDNWSGSTLLPAFVSSLKSRPRKGKARPVRVSSLREFDSEGGPERREGYGQYRFGRNRTDRGLA